ncbi:hypothetical protein BDZ94DRAFT_1274692 [Collybia nuda]|uniref:Uncharacterized protein n=1 Tax=Collybia nuda TaxID=64659 RepID=A0A9P5XU81_9AGAR|nr:hypothetical protein BDZ94DRAFT_1274692 [Collybia nuda]
MFFVCCLGIILFYFLVKCSVSPVSSKSYDFANSVSRSNTFPPPSSSHDLLRNWVTEECILEDVDSHASMYNQKEVVIRKFSAFMSLDVLVIPKPSNY